MVQQLPVLVVREVCVDELAGVGEEVEGVEDVAHILHTRPLHNESASRPVTVDEAPDTVDENGVP